MNAESTIVNNVFARLVQLEYKFNDAPVGDSRRFYFNVALSVVRNYLNEVTCSRNNVIDAYLNDSRFYQEVMRVVKLGVHYDTEVELDYKLLIDKRINSLLSELQELKSIIKKCVKEK